MEALPEGVPACELLELADELGMPAEGEVRLDALLHREAVQLVQPGAHGARERLVDEIGERRAAPQRQRLPKPVRGNRRRGRVGLARQLLEAVQIERRGIDLDRIAATARGDDVAAEDLAQVRDVALEQVDRGLRRLVAPHLVDQGARRHHLACAQQQHGEDGPLARTAELEPTPDRPCLERTEDTELDAHSMPNVPEGPAHLQRTSRTAP